MALCCRLVNSFCSVIGSIWYVFSDVDGGDEQVETAVLERRDGMCQAKEVCTKCLGPLSHLEFGIVAVELERQWLGR